MPKDVLVVHGEHSPNQATHAVPQKTRVSSGDRAHFGSLEVFEDIGK